MAKHDLEHLAATYSTAERFVDSALRHDDSLFTPGQPIWSLPNLQELDRLYVHTPALAVNVAVNRLGANPCSGLEGYLPSVKGGRGAWIRTRDRRCIRPLLSPLSYSPAGRHRSTGSDSIRRRR